MSTMYQHIESLVNFFYIPNPVEIPAIVTSIEFDKTEEIFATVGTSGEIKLFEYQDIIKGSGAYKCPFVVLKDSIKISCVTWSSVDQHKLVTSDYSGSVIVWDVVTKQKSKTYFGHHNRCWSVDFNKHNDMIISGSDDCTAKLWSSTSPVPVANIKFPSIVTCAKFNPKSEWHFAISSADSCVYYYDQRNLNVPMATSRDNKKPVSIIRFLGSDEIVSATTTGQIKIWNYEQNQNIQTFTELFNDGNFIGLATNGEYIACGSEYNALFVHHQDLTIPTLVFSFDADEVINPNQLQAIAKNQNTRKHFVSAICWTKEKDALIAGNSQGFLKVLKLS